MTLRLVTLPDDCTLLRHPAIAVIIAVVYNVGHLDTSLCCYVTEAVWLIVAMSLTLFIYSLPCVSYKSGTSNGPDFSLTFVIIPPSPVSHTSVCRLPVIKTTSSAFTPPAIPRTLVPTSAYIFIYGQPVMRLLFWGPFPRVYLRKSSARRSCSQLIFHRVSLTCLPLSCLAVDWLPHRRSISRLLALVFSPFIFLPFLLLALTADILPLNPKEHDRSCR